MTLYCTSGEGAAIDSQELFVFYCSLCAFSSKTMSEVIQHMLSHDDENPYACMKCKEKFNDESLLETHLLTHSATSYLCEICDKRFSEELLFEDHMKLHKVTVERQAFACNFCEAKFSSESEFRDHLSIHSEKSQFACNVCDVKCDSLFTLRIHSKLFNHPNGFHVCSHCEKSFSDLPSFLSHKKTHKEFFCSCCHRGFSEEKFLKTHMRVHEKIYICSVCKLELPSCKDLDIHMKDHSPTWECPTCKVKYHYIEILVSKYDNEILLRQGRPSNTPRPARLTEKHFPDTVPPTTKKCPSKRCVVCHRAGMRKESKYWCADCRVGGVQLVTPYFSSHMVPMPPMKFIIHTLEKKSGTARKSRRRCRECYRQMKASLGSGKAGTTAKQVTTFCAECPGQPPLCLPCFNKLHQKLAISLAPNECERAVISVACTPHILLEMLQCQYSQTSKSKYNIVHKKCSSLASEKDSDDDQEETSVFCCSVCSFSSQTLDEVCQHMNLHSDQFQYVCTICSETFSDESLLKNHSCSNSFERAFSCQVCEEKFSLESLLENHIATHNKSAEFTCGKCNVNFYSESVYNNHMITHSENPIYKCQLCDLKFLSESLYNVHMRMHITNTFKCALCTETFDSFEKLIEHSETLKHPNAECLHTCNICRKKFFLSSDLLYHFKIHDLSAPYVCKICIRGFNDQKYFKDHMAYHGELHPYHCYICYEVFKTDNELRLHRKTHACFRSRNEKYTNIFTEHTNKYDECDKALIPKEMPMYIKRYIRKPCVCYVNDRGFVEKKCLKLGIHEKTRLCHLSQDRFFSPPIRDERLGISFMDVPKFVLIHLV
ncbi:Zinc finger protein 624 [Araneus ventricosus]|uniref:Zinc finger protein 624 n=1 Tax=Araneus ventricosus TaxID=182803 RepID=A0A4Y2CMV4_ARAVE|nr:Zinc finger protein 624 [Araneus ventricosus]